MTGSAPHRENGLSWTLFGFNIFLCAVAVALTFFWMDILREKDGSGGLVFEVFVAPAFFGVAFLFSLLPAAFMFFRHRHVLDRRSLWLSGFTLAVVVAETVYLFNTPLRGA